MQILHMCQIMVGKAMNSHLQHTFKWSELHHIRTKISAKNLCGKSVSLGKVRKCFRVYAVLDGKSIYSLTTSELFDIFNVQGEALSYTLHTYADIVETTGRIALLKNSLFQI